MVFAGVYDVPEANALERLDEQHDCGDARARDCGGIVERPGRHAMGGAGDFAYGLVAKIEEVRMEGDRLDIPNARPLDGAFFFGGESMAGLDGFLIHLRQDFCVEVALIECSFAAADDGGDNSWKCLEASHGADCVGMFASNGAHFQGELCGGG